MFVLGLNPYSSSDKFRPRDSFSDEALNKFSGTLKILNKIRSKARGIDDYDTSDFIRDELSKLGYEIQDKD